MFVLAGSRAVVPALAGWSLFGAMHREPGQVVPALAGVVRIRR